MLGRKLLFGVLMIFNYIITRTKIKEIMRKQDRREIVIYVSVIIFLWFVVVLILT